MTIYFLTRYGNGTNIQGPDSSEDTHMIVRASSLQHAVNWQNPLPCYGNQKPCQCSKVWKREMLNEQWQTYEDYHGKSSVEY